MPPGAIADMARVHAAAFAHERGWSAGEIADLLDQRGMQTTHLRDGFALIRVIADEAEVITLAVHPKAQGQGLGGRLLDLGLNTAAAAGARTAFLEVAADNRAALRLYASRGFALIGKRPRYYPRKDAPPADALIMRASLTRGQPRETPGDVGKTG